MTKNIISISLPSLFADHHVIEVRRLILEMTGVKEVYASSAFQVAEITTDGSVAEDKLLKVLEEAGYLGELPIDREIEISPVDAGGKSKEFRHSALYEHTKQAISFKQEVKPSDKELWPIPGIGPVEKVAD